MLYFKLAIVSLVLFLTNIQGQSIGVSYESNSFNVYSFFYNYVPARGNIKNIFVIGEYSFAREFQVSLKTGFGWNNYYFKSDQIRPAEYAYIHTIKTTGIPTEVAISYYPLFVEEHSVAPFLSLGVGYYSYNTNYQRHDDSQGFKYEYNTKGFCQFLCFGANITINKDIQTFVEFKHYLNVDLRTKWEINYPTEHFKFEADYSSTESALDFSLSIGFLFTL